MLRTSRQKRNLCRSCPIARVADIAGDSVSILILRDLLKRQQGFTDLELLYQGISSRTLASKLKSLEKNGLVTRIPKVGFYPRVNYRLTKKGAAFDPVISAMRRYGNRYL